MIVFDGSMRGLPFVVDHTYTIKFKHRQERVTQIREVLDEPSGRDICKPSTAAACDCCQGLIVPSMHHFEKIALLWV